MMPDLTEQILTEFRLTAKRRPLGCFVWARGRLFV